MLDVVTIADREDQEISIALNIICCKLTCKNAVFHVAVADDYEFRNALAHSIIYKYSGSIYRFRPPNCVVDKKAYRIANKWACLSIFDSKPVVFCDSDVLFLRHLHPEFLFRGVPAAVPEYGLHVFPWREIFEARELVPPSITISLLGPEVGPVWLNAGFIACPSASRFGHAWKEAADYINTLDWVPEKFPYLDQISLPLAMASVSPQKTVDHSNVLPDKFNQHFIYWRSDLEYVSSGFVAHHHNRVTWMRRFLPSLFQWVGGSYPVVEDLLKELSRFDPYEAERVDKQA